MKAMNLSVSTCCVPHLSRLDAYAMFARTGYKYVENFCNWTMSKFDVLTEKPAQLKSELESFGLSLSSLNVGNIKAVQGPAWTDQLDMLKRNIELANELGAHIVNVKGGQRTAEDMQALIAGVLDLARHIENDTVDGQKVMLCLGNHLGNRLERLDDYLTVFNEVRHPNVRVLLDIGHFHSANVDVFEVVEALNPHIGLVHTKDQIGQQSVPFGMGELAHFGLINRVLQSGYRGFLVTEIEVSDLENIERYLLDGRHYLKRCISAAQGGSSNVAH